MTNSSSMMDEWADDPEMQQLLNEFIESLPPRRERLLAALGRIDPAALNEIRQIAHNLKGVGETYGFPMISRVGGALDELLSASLTSLTEDRLNVFVGLFCEVLEKSHSERRDPASLETDPRFERLQAEAAAIEP